MEVKSRKNLPLFSCKWHLVPTKFSSERKELNELSGTLENFRRKTITELEFK